MNDYLSTWTLIRASGFLAYYLLTLSLGIGLLSTISIMKKKKGILIQLHQFSGWTGFLTIIFHILLLWRDSYAPYSLAELFVPFGAKNEPLLSGLGTLSFYLFLIVLGSGDFFMKKLGKLWKRMHMLVFPAWLLMCIHGMVIGTDSSEPWALLIYTIGISFILVLGFLRIVDKKILKQAANSK
ncbi:ferric reductase-like transmembrane domain-containing protein [Neobacillus sp. LXY-1]|uniref:ferric reductase-like transmembrane domain-containing protein n=1 Tax=Neobacillus sp. LXY-1 TaxID=3379133 RepID=UPI003EDF0D0E